LSDEELKTRAKHASKKAVKRPTSTTSYKRDPLMSALHISAFIIYKIQQYAFDNKVGQHKFYDFTKERCKMCSSNVVRRCCPSAQILQEKICGNFNGPLVGESSVLWRAPLTSSDYIQGTFEVFVSTGAVTAAVISSIPTENVTFPVVSAGNTLSRSVNFPIDFRLTDIEEGDSGTFCITLYKRILA
jgi:hypothetical protein